VPDEQRGAAAARLSADADEDVEGPLNAAAQAVADGANAFPTINDSVEAGLLSELKVIAQIAGMHRDVDAEPDPGTPGTDSLGDMMSRAGQPRDSRPDLTRARRWGNLFILDKVGGGSFGEVYRAWDPALDREVALKLLRLAQPSSARADAVVREGRLLAKLHHPNVIDVYGAAKINGEVGIWMEFVRGRTLERIVLEEGPMSAQEASLVAESLCGALAAVHQQGLLHRDIKAANVMRESGGRYVLLDFGTGTEVTPDATALGRMAGTPLYMAPEVIENAPATTQSDIYSLGVLLFFLVTGSYPVYAKTMSEVRSAHRSGRRVLLSDVRSNLPGWFVRVVEKASAPRIRDRYSSFGEMLLAIDKGVAPSDRSDGWASPWIHGAGLVVGGLAVLTLLGFVTSTEFSALGRRSALTESPWLWPYWGLRSLVAPVALAALVRIVWVLMRTVFTGVLALTILRPLRERLSQITRRVQDRLVCTPVHVIGEALLVVQVLAFLLGVWRFGPLLQGLRSVMDPGPASELMPLRPSNAAEHGLFRQVFSLQLIVFAFAWRWMVRFAKEKEVTIWVPSIVAGLGGLALTASLLSLPYRTLYQNNAEEAIYKGKVCYLLSAVNTQVQLFCPREDVPRTRTVDAQDPQLLRSGVYRNVFSPFDEAAQ